MEVTRLIPLSDDSSWIYLEPKAFFMPILPLFDFDFVPVLMEFNASRTFVHYVRELVPELFAKNLLALFHKLLRLR